LTPDSCHLKDELSRRRQWPELALTGCGSEELLEGNKDANVFNPSIVELSRDKAIVTS
jgi:hypothetical protein